LIFDFRLTGQVVPGSLFFASFGCRLTCCPNCTGAEVQRTKFKAQSTKSQIQNQKSKIRKSSSFYTLSLLFDSPRAVDYASFSSILWLFFGRW
jgi:hypothetical protein